MKDKILIYVYGKCSTCQAALRFLKERKVPFDQKEITQEPPSIQELALMLDYQKGNLKKLFNTSGLLYQEMQLKEKLIHLSLDEALLLLHQNGMLVKRPFLIGPGFGLIGFKEVEWVNVLC